MTLNSRNFKIQANNRVFFAGQTGSGKTMLAEYLLKPANRLLVLDAKDTLENRFDLDVYNRKNIRRLRNGDNVRLRIVPPISSDEFTLAYWESIFRDAFYIKNLIIYIDEINAITNGANTIEYFFRACYTRGRELGIGMWGAAQRPVQIPKITLTESDHYFCFRLNDEDDRKRMGGYMGKPVLTKAPDEHGFYYYNNRLDTLAYYPKIDL